MTSKIPMKKCVPEARMEEYEDLLALLTDNLGANAAGGPVVAEWVAASCLGDNHLWQDMGFESREGLSALMRKYFPPLYEANVQDMKWKKFFYKQICSREGFMLCKSPSCGECVDYHKCFGPDDAQSEKRTGIWGRQG
jgi:nitrogen fixation protein NifQ